MAADAPTRPSLRERKKAKTRAAIRKAAYRLAAEHGWEAATTDRIAAAAEVSPSTVARYFPVREDILLTDEDDALLEARLRARPAGEDPLESLRAVLLEAVRTAFAEQPEETRLRARLTETTTETGRRLTRVLAARTGRAPDALEVRVFTAAVLGALRETTAYWAEHDRTTDLLPLLDRTLDTLKGGPALP
ncbi:TetR/AcrR family transcriptional regulator [Streptomyces sp. NPDC007910]|uniref:TetR/AcrR family transcriptional regulator n=1 Tax=Streptomyces sp. NPDC007910 TaxID=3364790 RepID=UPI0036F02829